MNERTQPNTLTLTACVSSGEITHAGLVPARNTSTLQRNKLPLNGSAAPEQFPKCTDRRVPGYCFIPFCSPPPQWRCVRSLQRRLKMRADGWLLLEGGAGNGLGELTAVLNAAAASRMELSAVLKQERDEAVLSQSLALCTLLFTLYNRTELVVWQPTVQPTPSHQWRDWTCSRKPRRPVTSTATALNKLWTH